MKKRILFAIFGISALLSPLLVTAKTSNDPQVEQWSYEDAGVYRAWDVATGSRQVVVAIIDNGFDTFHPDLRNNAWKNENEIADNGVDDDRNGYIDDVWGWNFVDNNNDPRPVVIDLTTEEREGGVFSHASVVAGIIGAQGNNGRDGAGLNWQVRLMNLKVIGNKGEGEIAPLAPAVRYAADNGADVINISMVGGEDADLRTAVQYAYDKGVAVVAAAGNNYFDLDNYPSYPICIDAHGATQLVLGVSAIDRDHHLARFSNTGSTCVDITAPGVGINSTIRYAPLDSLTESYGRNWQGTSFAAPFVSATAALIKSVQPTWKAPEIYEAILKTVHRTPPIDVAAYQNSYGAGLIQVDKALDYALRATSTIPTVSPAPSPAPIETPVEVVAERYLLRAVLPGKGAYADYYFPGEDYVLHEDVAAVKGIDDLAHIRTGDTQSIVTSRALSRSRRQITVYNADWQEKAKWTVAAGGPLTVRWLDQGDGAEPRVVVAPAYKEKWVYRVYSRTGKLQSQMKQPGWHAGVALATTGPEIAALFSEKNILKLHRYVDGKATGTFAVPSMGTRAYLTTLQNANGETVYIVGSGPGAVSQVAYYDSDGTMWLNRPVEGTTVKNGVQVVTFDYNRDGNLDVAVSPIGVADSFAWSARGKKLGEFSLYTPQTGGRIFFVPLGPETLSLN